MVPFKTHMGSVRIGTEFGEGAQMSRSKLGTHEKSLWHQSLAVLHLLNVNFGLDRGEK